MTNVWTVSKRALILVATTLLIVWAGALIYFFIDGAITPLRAGIKLLLIVGALNWLYDQWKLLAPKTIGPAHTPTR